MSDNGIPLPITALPDDSNRTDHAAFFGLNWMVKAFEG